MTFVRHYLLALQFFTRIPVTGRLAAWVGYTPAMLRASAAHFPGVGWIVGLAAAVVMALALHLLGGLPIQAGTLAAAATQATSGAHTMLAALTAALLSTAASVWLTGGFHEDGLADTCDGLGGGSSRERALHIMKDSRIGSYGALALALALGLKAALLALLTANTVARGAWPVAATLLAAHVLSRAAPLLLMRTLPYVGDAGGASKSKPLADAINTTGLLAGLCWAAPAVALLAHALGLRATATALALGALALLYMGRLLARRLQGFTGDTLGATQQVCELALYLGATCSLT